MESSGGTSASVCVRSSRTRCARCRFWCSRNHGVVLRLFVGGCPCRSQRQECIIVDSVVEVLRCSPSGVHEGIGGDSRWTVERIAVGAREGHFCQL